MNTKGWAVVTGASSGIGAAIAEGLGRRGFDLVVTARRGDRLEALASTWTSTLGVNVRVVAADLSTPEGLAATIAVCEEVEPAVLVNNAGAGWIGLFADAPQARQLEIVDLNCRAVVGLTGAVLPGMLARRRGRILQVASVAGFMPGPRASVYYASKAFVVSHSEALRHELKGSGVSVSVSCPGPVATEFQRSSGVKGTMGGAVEMSALDVAEVSIDGTLAGRFLIVPGAPNAALVALSRILPRRVSAALVDRIQRKRLEAPAVVDG